MTRLLVVDDEEQNRYLLQSLLVGNGHDVAVAVDGADALEKARANPPDMIITDILMPGMDGYTLCRHWKSDETLREIPLVFYTATYTDPKDEQFGLSVGADRYILKPQEPDTLLAMIEEVVNEHRAGQTTPPREPSLGETAYFKEYNEALIRKLEDKLVELECANTRLKHEAAERKRAEEALALHSRRVQALLDLQLLSHAPEAQILDFLLDACRSVTQSQYSLVGTVNEAETVMKVHRWSNEVMNACAFTDPPLTFSVPDGGWWTDCVRRREPVICNDYGLPHPSKKGVPEGHVAIERFVAVPVFDQDRVVAIAAAANKATDYIDDDVSALSTLLNKMWGILSRQRSERERKVLEEQYRQAQKMEAVGQLAGGVAHDFNNILQAITGYSQILMTRVPKDAEEHAFIEEIAKGAQRAAALTRQLLAFGRRQILTIEDLDLGKVVFDMTKMLRRLIGESVEVRFTENIGLDTIRGDRGQMEQVLLNLCINARDAMPEGGVLTIATENVEMDQEYCEVHAWASPGRYVMLSVTDTGLGMDPETQARIFEPFFTTKDIGKGTGLGLATVYGIVRQHLGMIQVYSEAGQGSVFKVYLPSAEPSHSPEQTKTTMLVAGGNETILVAEDDEMLRRLTTQILQNAGYKVLLAANGKEALDIFAAQASKIALVLLDVVMPKMGGKGVYDVLRAEHPHLRFLFTSGYADSIHTNFVLQEGIELLEKPCAPDALLRKVRDILDRPRGV